MEHLINNAEIRDVGEPDSRTIEFVISDGGKDRHGSVLNMDNWELDNFNNNGIVGFQHEVYGGGLCKESDPDTVIGIGQARLENGPQGKLLIGSVKFEPESINPLAEKIYQKVKYGSLKATSVGFKPIKDENGETGENGRIENGDRVDTDTFYYYGQELLEFSIVKIPSNPRALKRSLRDQTANAIHFIRKQIGEDISYGEIEQMRVIDVMQMLEDGKIPARKSKKDIQKSVSAELHELRNRQLQAKLKYIQQ